MRFSDDAGGDTYNSAKGKTAQGVYAFRTSQYTPDGQRLAGSSLGEVKDGYSSKNADREAAMQAAKAQKALYG